MAGRSGPKVRLSRRFGAPIAETPKHVTPKRDKPPGVHRRRAGRQSLYGNQLQAKQKVAAYYCLRDRQLRHYVQKARSSKRLTRQVLVESLETRMDNVIRRLRWARTIWQARQAVCHGHFLVNGRKADLPSRQVKPGDVVTVKEASRPFVRRCAESVEGIGFRVPDWLSVNQERIEAGIVHPPHPEEVLLPFDVDYSKIIEYYAR